MALPDFKLLRPRTVIEAVQLLSAHAPSVQVIAGGTDLIPSLKQRLFTPDFVLDIRGIDELRGISAVAGAGVEIGALTTISQIEDSGFLQRNYSVLHEAAKTVSSPILRNMGTLGGNLCLDTRCLWYNQSLAWRKSCGFCLKNGGDICHVAPGGEKCWAAFSGDLAPALLCLDAELEIAGPQGFRRISVADFYVNDGISPRLLQRGEIVTRVYLPESSAGWRGSYQKLRVRGAIDYPLTGIAAAIKLARGVVEDARVAVTGVNPAPMLVPNAEHALIGRTIDEHNALVVGELAAKIAKPLTTSALTPEYRREMVRIFAKRAVLAAAGGKA
ncbi:MAG TPA: FAD binding domain-containing protein [Clostridia bacterium]|nr:FAD binding domain-containing protein [Clostridia bacterium]